MARRGDRSAQDVPVNEIAEALDGIDFPKSKDEVLQYAEAHDASGSVMEAIRQLPRDRFNSMAGVMQAYGDVEGGDE